MNAKDEKGKVKNSFRAHKLLYYVVFDALCCSLFKQEMNVEDEDQLLPSDFQEKTDEDKSVGWMKSAAGFWRSTCLKTKKTCYNNLGVCLMIQTTLRTTL